VTKPRLRVLLVDDHPIDRRGLRNIVADAQPGSAIREVGTAAEATALGLAGTWDIMILDLSLPDGNGLDVLKRVRDEHPRLPILILSVHAMEQFARRAINAGASGYLTKDTADTELASAMERLLRGGRYFGTNLVEAVVLAGGRGADERPHERLSDREYQVLRMIGGGRTVSEIAAALNLSVKTISTYRARLLEKMRMRTNAELTRYAVEQQLAD
jgi:DNA-binding NarL/FixJ family response regulator